MKKFSPNVYETELAKYYDVMRQYRDYDRECNFVDNLIKRNAPGTKKVLDICCGTGEHAIRMSRLGYEVTGVDQSQDMLEIAEDKAKALGPSINFICKDIFSFDVNRKFETAYCLGYTFLYMITDFEVKTFLRVVRDSLTPGGLFIVDFINGVSLAKDFDKDEFTYHHEDTTIRQHDRWSLDSSKRVKHLDFKYEIIDSDDRVQNISAEENLRIFYENEVKSLLSGNDFTNVESYGDYSLERSSPDDPYIVIVTGQKGD